MEIMEDCLQQVEIHEPQVQAWAHFDPERARAAARIADELQHAGAAPGRLHGVPVGIKDIFDTADFPTENGSGAHRGRQPAVDCAAVERLRRAGAIIVGKTVTTEFAFTHAGRTCNPHDLKRTPGGSSSGSAAAVAAGMVPVALGSQTSGSTIRPASFCGVIGFVPSFGSIPRTGVFQISRFLDRVGLFARHIDDISELLPVLCGADGRDPDCSGNSPVAAAAKSAPKLALIRTPFWERAADVTRQGIEALAHESDAEALTLPDHCAGAWEWHRKIMCADLAAALAGEYATQRTQLGAETRAGIEFGLSVPQTELARLKNRALELRTEVDALISGFDALLTPAATDVAPVGLDYTGDPVFCSLWSLLGLPSISLPLLSGTGGLPIGVQLVGRRGGDAALLRAARWLETRAPAQA